MGRKAVVNIGPCKVVGCHDPAKIKGFCQSHYRRAAGTCGRQGGRRMNAETVHLLRDILDPAVHSDGRYCFFCGASVNKRSKAANKPCSRHIETCPVHQAMYLIISLRGDLKPDDHPHWKTVEKCACCGHPRPYHLDRTSACFAKHGRCKCDHFISEQVEKIRQLGGYLCPTN